MSCETDSSFHDLLASLKLKLKDANKNVVMQTIKALGLLGKVAGPQFERDVKTVAGSLLAHANDSKKMVRDSVMECLNVWKDAVGTEKLIPSVAEASLAESQVSRKDMAGWLLTVLENGTEFAKIGDSNILLKAALTSANDRHADIRNSGEKIVAILCQQKGVCQKMMGMAEKMFKPAAFLKIQPLLQKAEQLTDTVADVVAEKPTKKAAAEDATGARSKEAAINNASTVSDTIVEKPAQPSNKDSKELILIANDGREQRIKRDTRSGLIWSLEGLNDANNLKVLNNSLSEVRSAVSEWKG